MALAKGAGCIELDGKSRWETPSREGSIVVRGHEKTLRLQRLLIQILKASLKILRLLNTASAN